MRFLGVLLCWFTSVAPLQAQDVGWPVELLDPGAADAQQGPADLVLPLPCGAAMAFQRVLVPVESVNPLDDQRIRLGQSDVETGYAEYLVSAFQRGAFTDAETGASAYYIGRYEVTAGQACALQGDFASPGPADRLAQGGLSWFDAVDLSRTMTEWLLSQAPDALPGGIERRAFVRLPTENEWEYAARGGSRINPASYPARHFFEEGGLEDYALFGDGRRKTLGPIGVRRPNPLGLFDVYGNAEELMLEPFRMNVVGRAHGQAGGLVTRGGAIDAQSAQIYSAQRTEYSYYDKETGSALAGDYFGVRFVLSAKVVSAERFDAIRTSWKNLAEATPEKSGDALTELGDILKSEIDPRRRAALSGVQLQFRSAQEEARFAQQESAKSTLLSTGAFIEVMKASELKLLRLKSHMDALAIEYYKRQGDERVAVKQSMGVAAANFQSEESIMDAYLLVLRAALETLANDVDVDVLSGSYNGLLSDLNAANQTAIVQQVDAAWRLLGGYRKKPDMEPDALLALVLTNQR